MASPFPSTTDKEQRLVSLLILASTTFKGSLCSVFGSDADSLQTLRYTVKFGQILNLNQGVYWFKLIGCACLFLWCCLFICNVFQQSCVCDRMLNHRTLHESKRLSALRHRLSISCVGSSKPWGRNGWNTSLE